MLEELHPDKLLPSTDQVPERFELGTLPYELMAGITAAIDFLAAIDPDATGSRRDRLAASYAAIEQHEHPLRERIEQALAARSDATLWSRAPERTSTTFFTLAGLAPDDVHAALGARGVSISSGNCYAWEPCHRLGLGAAGAIRVGLAPYTDDATSTGCSRAWPRWAPDGSLGGSISPGPGRHLTAVVRLSAAAAVGWATAR